MTLREAIKIYIERDFSLKIGKTFYQAWGEQRKPKNGVLKKDNY